MHCMTDALERGFLPFVPSASANSQTYSFKKKGRPVDLTAEVAPKARHTVFQKGQGVLLI